MIRRHGDGAFHRDVALKHALGTRIIQPWSCLIRLADRRWLIDTPVQILKRNLHAFAEMICILPTGVAVSRFLGALKRYFDNCTVSSSAIICPGCVTMRIYMWNEYMR